MAIDTQDKRASAMLEPEVMPFPDSVISGVADRGWQLAFYTGITPAAIVLGTQLFIATQGASGDTYSQSGSGDTHSQGSNDDDFTQGGGIA